MNDVVPKVSLDALFRRNVSLREEQCALRDLDGTTLTYTQASNAVAKVAAQIASFGMPQKSAVALLLPNGRELAIALLAVMRCGHVPVPMPVAWRKSDLVRACREAEIGAMITTANFGPERLPELAADVAIEVFELSFPCAFGTPLPDGVLSLSDAAHDEPMLPGANLAEASAAGIGTMLSSGSGITLVLHSDDELLAAGLGSMLAGDVRPGDKIVSALSFANFAGLATALVPWLLSGGTLTLLGDLPAKGGVAFDGQTHVIATANLVPLLVAQAEQALASVSAVHFGGTSAKTSFPALNAKTVVDVIAVGEAAVIAMPRRERGIVEAVPLGAIRAGNTGEAAPVIVETSVEKGRLHLRGAMVPKDALREEAWLDSGYSTKPASNGGLYVIPPAELIAIGGLRFDLFDLERRVRASALISEIMVEHAPLIGTRLVITSDRPAETAKALLDAGLPRIVAASVRTDQSVKAKAG
jgi:hypothetical protein